VDGVWPVSSARTAQDYSRGPPVNPRPSPVSRQPRGMTAPATRARRPRRCPPVGAGPPRPHSFRRVAPPRDNPHSLLHRTAAPFKRDDCHRAAHPLFSPDRTPRDTPISPFCISSNAGTREVDHVGIRSIVIGATISPVSAAPTIFSPLSRAPQLPLHFPCCRTPSSSLPTTGTPP
jgi:hypothetical protein